MHACKKQKYIYLLSFFEEGVSENYKVLVLIFKYMSMHIKRFGRTHTPHNL